MSLTRCEIADAVDELDEQIAALQAAKADLYASYREELAASMRKPDVAAEIAALKKGIGIRRKRRAAPADVQAAEDLVDDVLAEIEAEPSRATRTMRERAREIVEEFSAADAATARAERSRRRVSESMADHKDISAELLASGTFSADAHAENVAIADAIAAKHGASALPAHDPETGEIAEEPCVFSDREPGPEALYVGGADEITDEAELGDAANETAPGASMGAVMDGLLAAVDVARQAVGDALPAVRRRIEDDLPDDLGIPAFLDRRTNRAEATA
jgi:hypothetical protein